MTQFLNSFAFYNNNLIQNEESRLLIQRRDNKLPLFKRAPNEDQAHQNDSLPNPVLQLVPLSQHVPKPLSHSPLTAVLPRPRIRQVFINVGHWQERLSRVLD